MDSRSNWVNIWSDWVLKCVLTKSDQMKVDNARDTVVSSAANNICKNEECH